MTVEEYYPLIDQSLALILENLDKILIISQAMIILFCGIIIYHLFWSGKK